MKAKVLIVDGHSMIFQWPDLAAAHARQTAVAREALIKMLTSLHDNSDWHVAVVFDGKGDQSNEASEPGGIQVFYSKKGQTADTVIERLVATYATRYDVTVATDDHMERTTTESFGATAISSWQLRGEIEAAAGELVERLKQLRRR